LSIEVAMFSKEETNLLFWRYVVLLGILGIMSILGHNGMWLGVPVWLWTIFLWWVAHSFYSWQDRRELLKRCLIALPVAFSVAILLWLTNFRILICQSAGVLLFLALIGEAKNLKRHYVVTIIVAILLILLIIILTTLFPFIKNFKPI
jgi:hypothetical protein